MKLKLAVPKQPRYPLSISEAADVIGVSASLLRFYEQKQIVRPIRFGRDERRLFLPEHIDAVRAYREQRCRK